MSVISYKCPNCDGELIFDPASGKYKCEYCFSPFSQEELDAMQPAIGEEAQAEAQYTEQEQEEKEQEKGKGDGMVYTCPSCGAQLVTDDTTAATFCYYCHNPVVLGGRLSGEFLPDKVIPFTIDKKKAVSSFLEYVGSKKFVPRAFFKKQQIEMISGVYFPYWVCDTKMQGSMNATATKLRVWVVGEEEFTETRFYEVERSGSITLQKMTENALKKAGGVLADGVLPYRFEEAKDFSFGYLSGFLAEKRDMESEEVKSIIEQEAREYGEKMLQETIEGYSSVTGSNSSFSIEEEAYRYMLLPVWTVTYKGRNGKMYYYSMNGQTGKVCGELPVDNKKVVITAGLITAFLWLLGLLGGYFIW